MLKQTSQTLVLEHQDKKSKLRSNETSAIFSKNSYKTQNIETINTIKVDFNKMSKTKIHNNPYTQCECKAIVTVEDKKQKVEMEDGMYVWNCRFCKKVNKTKELFYCETNYRAVTQKNIQRGYLPPILIFLIDQSGSMGESISVELDSNANNPKNNENLVVASKEILNIMENSSFYQKQLLKQEQMKNCYRYEEIKEQFKKANMSGTKYFSRISFYMAVIQNYLKKHKSQFNNSQFRIGFIFFNDFIHILKPTKQKLIPTFVQKGQQFDKTFPFEPTFIDFYDFESLFKAGQKYERFFGDSRLKTADLSKLMVENLETKGLTALGPSLALALGIISVHDIGSRIVVVSDEMPNKGILSPQTMKVNGEAFRKINKLIQQKQTTIGILNWISENNLSYRQKISAEFMDFLNSDKQRIKEISLDFSLRQGHLEVLNTAKKSLQTLINRGSLGSALSIQIFISNPKIEASKFKYDDIDFRFIKFIGLQGKNWIQLKPKKVTEQDFLFPIETQIVVEYEDVFTKEKYIFMSYVRHKLICTQNEKQVFEYLEHSNQCNIRQLIDLQKIHQFDKESVISQYNASRASMLGSQDMKNMMEGEPINMDLGFNQCDSLNYYADIENRRNQEDNQDVEYL